MQTEPVKPTKADDFFPLSMIQTGQTVEHIIGPGNDEIFDS